VGVVIRPCPLNSLGRTIMNEMYSTRVCLPAATAAALVVLIPFAQLRSYGDITSISLVSFAAVLILVGLIMSASSHVERDATVRCNTSPCRLLLSRFAHSVPPLVCLRRLLLLP
jgi:hypothetical protein